MITESPVVLLNQSDISIQPITFETIKGLWQNDLWKGRISPIEATSALNHDLSINNEYASLKSFHFAAFSKDNIIGTLSGHPTKDEYFRIRGLWVNENYRRQGIAKALVKTIELMAIHNSKSKLWSLPRVKSWTAYCKIGFKIINESQIFEFGPHYIVEKNIG